MYLARAKNILILLLLGLNIFLAVNLVIYNSDRGAAAEAEVNADAILRTRNIEIACSIPKLGGTATRLNFICDGFDRAKLAEKLLGLTIEHVSGESESCVMENGSKKLVFTTGVEFIYIDDNPGDEVDMTKNSRMEQYAAGFLKEKQLMPKAYIIDRFIKNADSSATIVFIEKYSGKLIFDNHLDVTVTSKGITKLAGSHRSIKKAERAGIDSIMTARQVLLKNFTGSEKLVIASIDVGYKANGLSEHNIKASSEEPVLRIIIKGNETPEYYNVFNGVRIK